MKRLVLVRHARAVQWGYDADFNRELTERGKSDAAKVAHHLGTSGIIPDIVISSPASRAYQTAVIFAGELQFDPDKIVIKHELYEGLTTGELIELIHDMPEESNCLFLFGHNPAFGFYAQTLTLTFNGELPTSSAVVVDFDTDLWKKVTARSGLFFAQFNPKEISV
jgi:phosphohistidine phosphatase